MRSDLHRSPVPASRGARRAPTSRYVIAAVLLCMLALLLARCANPEDYDVNRTVTTSFVDQGEDDPRFDTLTARTETSIRFEPLIDTSFIKITHFKGSGLNIAVVCMLPDTNLAVPYRDICSFSSTYLDGSPTGLPLRAAIPAEYFKRYIGARVAIAAIVLYKDVDNDSVFDYGEPIYGMSEEHLFAFGEGKRISQIPTQHYGELREGPNHLVRQGTETYPWFKTSPDYYSTIFRINVRGPDYPYKIPYPWPMIKPLQHFFVKRMVP